MGPPAAAASVRAHYSADVDDFLRADPDRVLGALTRAAKDVTEEQKDAWLKEIDVLQRELRGAGGRLFLEFVIPRMGKRADAVLVHAGTVFVMEFKVKSRKYDKAAVEQCVDYALDLKNFHEGSRDIPIVPVLVATEAKTRARGSYTKDKDGVFFPVKVGKRGLGAAIAGIAEEHPAGAIEPVRWERFPYNPTPTIIEAALAMYAGQNVAEITRSEGGENLGKTTDTVEGVIKRSKRLGKKSICFVTGVPGAGKTLAGLNLAGKRRDYEKGERAIYVSGNGPLVKVLQEALARDKIKSNRLELEKLKKRLERQKADAKTAKKEIREARVSKTDALREANVIIQALRNFVHESLANPAAPAERIVIFDEAQRAWTARAMNKALKKLNLEPHNKSQATILLDAMNRHGDWAVVVCLVGGGQEINHDEGGLPEWFNSLRCSRAGWEAYVPDMLDKEHLQGKSLDKMLGGARFVRKPNLHLATSVRSFRSERVSEFVGALLDLDEEAAKAALGAITKKRYPVVLTRDFGRAKEWLRFKARGTQRFGVVAAAKSYRLMPHGIYVQVAADATKWFLNTSEDPRSAYSCEYAATEFEVQGLELDWACVAWDADLRLTKDGWSHHEFRGSAWTRVRKEDKQMYLKNAYRVLLTRARQGMVVFVPEGDPGDPTRRREFYDRTYRYLKRVGLEELPPVRSGAPSGSGQARRPVPARTKPLAQQT